MYNTHTLRIFRPHRTPAGQLEKTFVAREPLLQEILNKLLHWQPGKSRQHYLIIGPRGIGKSNLLRLVEYRIEKNPEINRKWHTITLSEDAYGITKVADLLIEGLRILADKTADMDIRNAYDRIKYDDNDQRVTDLSLDAFRKFHGQHKCGLLFMVENVNRVFENQFKVKEELHLLRKILIEEDWLTLISTSPTFLKSVTEPEKPLFEFFQVKLLEELTPEEQQEMLEKIARLENKEDFIKNYLNNLKPQLHALYHFTGGNPRLTIMLYDLIVNQRITRVKIELDSLLDQLTPFYQDRMKEISEQEAKLLEKMALLEEGGTPKELAREARMGIKHVSALLSRLERTGYVRREPRRLKRTVYIIPERFFRIWHQMNHSRAARGRIQYLLEFFTSWYATSDERNEIWEKLSEELNLVLKEKEEERIYELSEFMEYIEEISEGEEKYNRHFDRLYQVFNLKGFDAIRDELEQLDKQYQEDGIYYLHKGFFLSKKTGKKEEALAAFLTANELIPDNIIILFNLGLLLSSLKRYNKADKFYQQLIEILRERENLDKNIKTEDLLLRIFQYEKDYQLVRIVSVLIRKFANKRVIDKTIHIIQSSRSPVKKQIGITTLGFLRSRSAVPVILSFLKDAPNNVRGSAASALGRIGDRTAVPTLIDCLKDEDNGVRGSAASALGNMGAEAAVSYLIGCLQDNAQNVRISSIIALGKIASRKPIQNVDQVIQALIEIKTDHLFYLLVKALRKLLDSAFRSGDMAIIEAAVGHAKKGFENGDEIFKPYTVALEYLNSRRDPAVMERQHPEMRDAVQLLVQSFDKKLTL